MKKNILTGLLLVILTFLAQGRFVEAHPGRTASDGCHYCRTNCDRWGEAWNVRHCHGGSSIPAPSTPAAPPKPQGTIGQTQEVSVAYAVMSVVDGDTIKVKDTDGDVETIRLIGIDTPETVHPTKPVECFGKEASAQMQRLVADKKVYLKRDTMGDTIDAYGRHLRYVTVVDAAGRRTEINATMISDGYAYAYTTYPFDKNNAYVALQKQAEQQKVGLWADGVCGNPAKASTATQDIPPTWMATSAANPVSASALPAQTQAKTSEGDSAWWVWVGLLIGGVFLYPILRKPKRNAKV